MNNWDWSSSIALHWNEFSNSAYSPTLSVIRVGLPKGWYRGATGFGQRHDGSKYHRSITISAFCRFSKKKFTTFLIIVHVVLLRIILRRSYRPNYFRFINSYFSRSLDNANETRWRYRTSCNDSVVLIGLSSLTFSCCFAILRFTVVAATTSRSSFHQ